MTGLFESVETFAQCAFGLADTELERPWAWNGYEEGVRFAFFRTYEELRELAARLHTQRAASSNPLTAAQYILAQYHAAYRDLQAILLGVGNELALQRPAPEEWPLRTVLLHMLEAEIAFLFINRYAVERERAQDGRPQAISKEDWNALWSAEPFEKLKDVGSFSELLDYYPQIHQRVLEAFTAVNEVELSMAVIFWETTAMPLEFRLHRFDSHLRQHTIQVEKTLAGLGAHPNEARRLLRLIYAALAELESVQIGASEFGAPNFAALAAQISQRTTEIFPGKS